MNNILLFVCLLCVLFISSNTDKSNLEEKNTAIKMGTIKKGTGNFTYDNYPPLAHKPIDVFYFSPKEDIGDLKILIVMSGINRNADEYRDYWIDLAKQYNLLIVAPKFSNEFYPNSRSYNLGNMFDEHDQPLPEDQWSFSIIEHLVDDVKKMANNSTTGFYLFGHSAGAQFVHRFLFFKPFNQVKAAVAANAGWYTIPKPSVDFPYGLSKSPIRNIQPIIFRKKLLVLLGEDDHQSESPNLRHTPEADEQGNNRFSRGFYFFDQSQSIAKSLNCFFQWKILTVPNVEHSAAQMSPAAAKWLFEK